MTVGDRPHTPCSAPPVPARNGTIITSIDAESLASGQLRLRGDRRTADGGPSRTPRPPPHSHRLTADGRIPGAPPVPLRKSATSGSRPRHGSLPQPVRHTSTPGNTFVFLPPDRLPYSNFSSTSLRRGPASSSGKCSSQTAWSTPATSSRHVEAPMTAGDGIACHDRRAARHRQHRPPRAHTESARSPGLVGAAPDRHHDLTHPGDSTPAPHVESGVLCHPDDDKGGLLVCRRRIEVMSQDLAAAYLAHLEAEHAPANTIAARARVLRSVGGAGTATPKTSRHGGPPAATSHPPPDQTTSPTSGPSQVVRRRNTATTTPRPDSTHPKVDKDHPAHSPAPTIGSWPSSPTTYAAPSPSALTPVCVSEVAALHWHDVDLRPRRARILHGKAANPDSSPSVPSSSTRSSPTRAATSSPAKHRAPPPCSAHQPRIHRAGSTPPSTNSNATAPAYQATRDLVAVGDRWATPRPVIDRDLRRRLRRRGRRDRRSRGALDHATRPLRDKALTTVGPVRYVHPMPNIPQLMTTAEVAEQCGGVSVKTVIRWVRNPAPSHPRRNCQGCAAHMCHPPRSHGSSPHARGGPHDRHPSPRRYRHRRPRARAVVIACALVATRRDN